MTSTGIVLEMTSPTQLSPGRRHEDLVLTKVPSTAGGRVGVLYRQIWEPIGGGGRGSWTDDQWVIELAPAGVRAIVGLIDGVDVAMAQIVWSGTGDAAFVVIGVVPLMQGRGIGGDFLSRLTAMMWCTCR